MTLERILYVEDETDIQAVARMALEMVGGYTLQICSSGQEALEAAPAFDPHLILLDVMMPGMDGPTTLQNLRQLDAFASTPAIFMTAKVQPAEVAHYKSLGAIGVIAKPFDPMSLSNQIKELWEEASRG
ncbi:response regulator [Desulfurispira natronophila]|uniref:CheY-like chemotaxis protein n=1 Tax=Desulfurispira natronophila TaxID=682562 RepID=A0A7W8DHI0_9BACT|nr:CheY-like chemotaxis protein [Desulfurispira natronophila]